MSADVNSDSEEEILVYAEFSDNVNINKYRSVHVLGIDAKNPIIQADETFFTGKYAHPLGTFMFFEEDSAPQSVDPLFDKLPEKNLKYVCKTNKLLNLDVAYVMPKEGSENNNMSVEAEKSSSDDIQEVKFSSIEEALTKFRSVLTTTNKADLDFNSQIPMETEHIEKNNSLKTEQP